MRDPGTRVVAEADPGFFTYSAAEWQRIDNIVKPLGIDAHELDLRKMLEAFARVYLRDLQRPKLSPQHDAGELGNALVELRAAQRRLETFEWWHIVPPDEVFGLLDKLVPLAAKLEGELQSRKRAPKPINVNALKIWRKFYLSKLQNLWNRLVIGEPRMQRKQMVAFMLACVRPVMPTATVHTINNFLDKKS